MSRYRDGSQRRILERESQREGNRSRKTRFRLTRSKQTSGTQENDSSFQNYLMLGSLDASGRPHSDNAINLVRSGMNEELKVFLNDMPEYLRLKDQLQGASLLHLAVEDNQCNVINTLLELQINVNVKDDDGNTPLHWSVIYNSIDSMLVLLDAGAEVANLNNDNESVLHLAVLHNRVEFVEKLLSSGHDINLVIPGPKLKTPLHFVAELDNLEMVNVFLEFCSKKEGQFKLCARDAEDNTPVNAAARHGSAKVMEAIFTCAAKHGYPKERLLKFITLENSTPLHNAVDGGHIDVIKFLISFGADPFCTEGQLIPPFHIAASMSDPSCILAMIDCIDKDKINTKDQEDRTGLSRAIASGNLNIAVILLEHGADANIKCGTYGDTALHQAVRINAGAFVCKLLEYDANHFEVNGNGDTVLHLALKLPNLNVIVKILEHGDSTKLAKIKNNQNLRPIQLAVKHNKIDAVKKLIECSKLCETNQCIYKPKEECFDLLHIAAEQGHLYLANLLIEDSYKIGKSLLNEVNENGLTPLHLATMEGHKEIVKLLLDYGAILHLCPVGNSPVATAACSGNLGIVQALIELFPYAKDLKNRNGISPLHLAASRGYTDVVVYLLQQGAKITLNNDGSTFFYDAIINDHIGVVQQTIKHKRWQEALDVLPTSRHPPFAALIIRMPSLAKLVLNKSIEKSSFSETKKDYWVKYNFKYLFPPPNIPILPRSESIKGGEVESNSISFSISSTLRATEKLFEYKKVDKMYILNMMRKFERKDLLTHPLVIKLLQAKWVRYGSSIYAISLLTFFIFLLLLSVFPNIFPPIDSCGNENWWPRNFSVWPNATYYNTPGFYVYRTVLEAMALFYLLLLTIGAILAKHKMRYIISIHSIVEFLCYICTLIFLPLHTPCLNWGAGAFALFFGWITFVFYLGQYGLFALYTRMLIAVFKTVIFMLPLVFIILLSFAYAFNILLTVVITEHKGLERSLLVVFQMLIGEPGFGPVTDFAFQDGELPNKGIIYFFFVLSGLTITIMLTNLLIGLAVGDIANVREGAYLQRVKDRIIFFGNMDRAIPSWIKREEKHIKIIEYPNRHKLGKIYVIWKQIVELVSPSHKKEIDEVSMNDEQALETRMASLEKGVQEIKELFMQRFDGACTLKKLREKQKQKQEDTLMSSDPILPSISEDESEGQSNRRIKSSYSEDDM